ncbi:MAG: ABC-three component system protein [Accumulibacter sp.]|jgi:uncharacterized protein YydD (DUF2326 family)|uniref:ABC-three component system protein n=1 Tax=Accumulibacter sp. TaxID=2053492 RepID=UPI002FC35B53
MIHTLYSDLPTFKTLHLQPGLNVLLAEKSDGATQKQTRNRAGKTSVVELIHFLLGADSNKDSLFQVAALREHRFGMICDIGGRAMKVERRGANKTNVNVSEPPSGKQRTLTNTEWTHRLGKAWFSLDPMGDHAPSYRALFAYFVRRQHSGAFSAPEKQATMQQLGAQQMALMYLLGLDWPIAGDWQLVRERDKVRQVLSKTASAGVFGSVIGKAADLRTQLVLAERKLKTVQDNLAAFKVLDEYAELEQEASQLTRDLNMLANQNTLDLGTIQDIEATFQTEVPPGLGDLEQVYRDAGVNLPPGLVKQRYEDVRAFHESVIRNRQSYLQSELAAARARIEARDGNKRRLDGRRAQIMGILQSHGALDQFQRLQAQTSQQAAVVETLRQRFAAAEKLESTKTELKVERDLLTLRLRRDFTEQSGRIDDAIRAFEETSSLLYESAGSMQVEATANGPAFKFPMQGSRSKGIKNMQIFCFDMMLMRLCRQRGIGPGFLVHDSHLFDGVDGRQVIRALRVAAQTANELEFQYLVTMNEDDAFKETEAGFDLGEYVLPVRLTDATEDGGLFGVRFD